MIKSAKEILAAIKKKKDKSDQRENRRTHFWPVVLVLIILVTWVCIIFK